jgi:putative ABC transport system substrate-binding protein
MKWLTRDRVVPIISANVSWLISTRIGWGTPLIIGLAARYRLPAVYAHPRDAAEGGLLSYGPDVEDDFRRSASYIDRILKGGKPADLPVQEPLKYELVINLRTAKALGLTVPNTLLTSAAKVID